MKSNQKVYSSQGIIYVLKNPYIPDIYKIGFTTRDAKKRAKDISRNTGVPGEWMVMHTWNVEQAFKTEQSIFKVLHKYRLDNNELFNFNGKSESEVITFISNIISKLDAEIKDKSLNKRSSASTQSTKASVPHKNSQVSIKASRAIEDRAQGKVSNQTHVGSSLISHGITIPNYSEEKIRYDVSMLLKHEFDDPQYRSDIILQINERCDQIIIGYDRAIASKLDKKRKEKNQMYIVMFFSLLMFYVIFTTLDNLFIRLALISFIVMILIIRYSQPIDESTVLFNLELNKMRSKQNIYEARKNPRSNNSIVDAMKELKISRILNIYDIEIVVDYSKDYISFKQNGLSFQEKIGRYSDVYEVIVKLLLELRR